MNTEFASSAEFMAADLARSGLTAEDLPFPPSPIDGGFTQGYRIWYNDDYYKDRFNRPDNKYIGKPGVAAPIVTFGNFEGAMLSVTVEGYKKALSFYKHTGIPTICIDGCNSYTIRRDIGTKALDPVIVAALDPLSTHLILFDGDWKTNPKVASALTTYVMMLDQLAVRGVPLDLGMHEGARLGADDWVLHVRGEDGLVPLETVKALPAARLDPLNSYKSHFLASPELFEHAYLDDSDAGLAALMIQLYGKDNIRYLVDTEKWALWDEGKWKIFDGEAFTLLNKVAHHLTARRATLYDVLLNLKKAGGEGEDVADKLAALKTQIKECDGGIARSRSVSGMRAVLAVAAGRQDIRDYFSNWDSNPLLLGVANGVLHLGLGVLRPEKQSDRISKRTAVPYVEGSKSPRWDTFITGITSDAHGKPNPDRLRVLQIRLGAMLRGANVLTSLDIWLGSGANGKSVLSSMLQAVLGEYSGVIPAAAVLSAFRGRDSNAATPTLARSVGKRIIFMAESADTAYLDEATVKSITGGDRFFSRNLYEAGGEYAVTFNLVLLTNNAPHVAQGDAALWDRLVTTRFPCRWRRSGNANPADSGLPEEDRWYADSAGTDSEFLRAILCWLVDGARMFALDGNVIGEEHALTSAAYKASEDKLLHFVEDCGLMFEPDGVIPNDVLYPLYTEWARREGMSPPAANIFIKRLFERFSELSPIKQYMGTGSDRKQKRGVKGLKLINVEGKF